MNNHTIKYNLLQTVLKTMFPAAQRLESNGLRVSGHCLALSQTQPKMIRGVFSTMRFIRSVSGRQIILLRFPLSQVAYGSGVSDSTSLISALQEAPSSLSKRLLRRSVSSVKRRLLCFPHSYFLLWSPRHFSGLELYV